MQDNANREQNKMNPQFLRPGVQFIFAFDAKIMQFRRIAIRAGLLSKRFIKKAAEQSPVYQTVSGFCYTASE